MIHTASASRFLGEFEFIGFDSPRQKEGERKREGEREKETEIVFSLFCSLDELDASTPRAIAGASESLMKRSERCSGKQMRYEMNAETNHDVAEK